MTNAKLILMLPSGLEQEFTLSKRSVAIGRASTGDIVLPDGRVSREHAVLESTPDGYRLLDLGSANGSYVNGRRTERAELTPGDLIQLGNTRLRYEEAPPSADEMGTIIDSEAQLDATIAQMSLSMAINETSMPSLVLHMPGNTREVLLTGEALSIGRHSENDLVLDIEQVSRQHARVERRGDAFVLRDLNSTNGTWMGSLRIEERRLHNGDSFQIGAAQFVFKSGFTAQELTLAEAAPAAGARPRRPVVFVPGMMGSELWLGRERVWPNVRYLFTNPEIYRLTEDSPLEARGLLNELVIVPHLIKIEQYNRLGDYLEEELGYRRNVDLLEFAYDWRRDVRDSARKLGEAIEAWDVTPPVTIVAYSLGTLVSRYYIERLGGKKLVERIILLGGPHSGAPKAATSLLIKPNLLPLGIMGDRLRQVLVTFPSSYQILPTYACAVDQTGKKISLFEDASWLEEEQVPMLRAASEFRKELGMHSSIPAVSVFGYGLKTITDIFVDRVMGGLWNKIDFAETPRGDSTIPESSAVLPGSEIHPVQQYHGALYVDNDVKMRLKLELTRS